MTQDDPTQRPRTGAQHVHRMDVTSEPVLVSGQAQSHAQRFGQPTVRVPPGQFTDLVHADEHQVLHRLVSQLEPAEQFDRAGIGCRNPGVGGQSPEETLDQQHGVSSGVGSGRQPMQRIEERGHRVEIITNHAGVLVAREARDEEGTKRLLGSAE